MKKFSDLIKENPAEERVDKSSVKEVAWESYDAILVPPEAMQLGTGTVRGQRTSFENLRMTAGDLARFNIIHRPDWTMGGSFHIELLVASYLVTGVITVTITHRSWAELSGSPFISQFETESFDTTPYTADDLVVLNYWDELISNGNEKVHGFLIQNDGSDIEIFGATVRHKANR